MPTFIRNLVALPCLALLFACSDSSDPSSSATSPIAEPDTFSASIRRTEFGIPHIKANDWGSLGYGYGYAYAQDNYCLLMREIMIASGRTAEFLGEEEGNIERDLFWVALNGTREDFYNTLITDVPQRVQDLVGGYAQGVNRYLQDTGAANLAEGDDGCRNAPWVYEIDEFDFFRHLRRRTLSGSSGEGRVRRGLESVTPPAPASVASLHEIQAPAGESLRALGETFRAGQNASNAIVAGRDATQTGSSVLLGNPHQGWSGLDRLYEVHLTIPGVYDAAGASLQGLPILAFGFSEHVAWTHTVDFAGRFTLYELKLNPDNPFEYEYDGQWRPITSETVSAKVLTENGTMETRSKTFYSSHYGRILDLGNVEPLLGGWPMFNGNLLTIRDGNLLTILRTAEEYINKSIAANMAEYEAALFDMGNPAFHEIAADRYGDILYGQISAVPHVTTEKLMECGSGPAGGLPISSLVAELTTNAILSLDGSRSECEWGEDPDSPPGTNLFGLSNRAVVRGGGTAGNANNSYWLSDPNNPLTGFPVIMGYLGSEGRQQTLRTRGTHQMIAERLAGTDGLSETPKFDLETMKALMYSDRVYGAEITLNDTLAICNIFLEAPPQDVMENQLAMLGEACDALAQWDRKASLDSRGAQVFYEYWRALRDHYGTGFQGVIADQSFWQVDFDPADPINTPRGIDPSPPENIEIVGRALLRSAERLTEAGVPYDAPWREVQTFERNGVAIPYHGGFDGAGTFSTIKGSLREDGYTRPDGGNSYIQVVTWDETECPIADTILTHSQSSDPASPHYGDQSLEYSAKRWVRFPFCEEEIVAAQIGETLVLEAPRVFPGRPAATE